MGWAKVEIPMYVENFKAVPPTYVLGAKPLGEFHFF